jgi:N-methylhydantoinase B
VHDAIEIEVFRHRITAVAEAMGAALQHASSSPNIKERLDLSCAVFDQAGDLVAQAAHIPVHLGAMPASVAAARQATAVQPGDVIVLNNPYLGGSHLPDITTVSGVYGEGFAAPRLFLATRAHHADVGGATPGSMGAAADLFGEGLVLPPVHLARGGRIDRDMLEVICANSRTPDERRGDLEAQVGAHAVGQERLAELLLAMPDIGLSCGALQDYSERRAKAILAALPRGRFTFSDVLESDGRGARDLTIAVTVTLDDDGLLADFEGTAPQVEGGVNMPLSVTRSAVYYVLACLLGDTPVNAGAFRPVRVSAPPGCLVNATHPAAVAAGNVETSQRVVDVLLGALAQAAPGLVPAASQGTMNNVVVGGVDPRTGRPFTYYETVAGGAGGGPAHRWASAIQVHMTNTRSTPVEALETAYPVRLEECRVRVGSGGAGRHPGGHGVVRRIRFLCPARVTLVGERRRTAPWGLAGGQPGAPGHWLLWTGQGVRELPDKCSLDVEAGDALEVQTPGGGGWGRGASGANEG